MQNYAAVLEDPILAVRTAIQELYLEKKVKYARLDFVTATSVWEEESFRIKIAKKSNLQSSTSLST